MATRWHRDQASWTVPVLAQYRADDRRMVEEIGRLTALETGLEISPLSVEHFCFLERLELWNYGRDEKGGR